MVENYGAQIRQAREARNMSPDELAERMGIARTTLNRMENGKIAVSRDSFNALVRILPLSADLLLLGMGWDITPAGLAARIPRSLQEVLLELSPEELVLLERSARGLAATRPSQDRTTAQ